MRFHGLNNHCATGLLLALSTLFVFFSCDLVEYPEAGKDTCVHLSVVSDAFATKGAEFSATELSANAKLYITAAMRSPKGGITTPSVFLSGSSPAFAQLEREGGTTWKLKGDDVVLPLGGYRFRALAFGADIDTGTVPSAFGTGTCWAPTLRAADAASGMGFEDVDTYGNQVDLMYGATGDITGDNPTGTVTLQHAMAQLIFNVKFTGAGTAFITSNSGSPDPKFVIDAILFVNNAGLVQYLSGVTVEDDNILLKTRGTFTIDNTGTAPRGTWSSLSSQDDKYGVDMTVGASQRRSQSNNSSVMTTPVLGGASTWNTNAISQGNLYQLGNPLLIPEQPFCNFIVAYTYDGNRYSNIVPLPTGTWRSGSKYIYNLEITRVGGIFTLTAAGQGIGGEYYSGNVDPDWM